MSQTATATAGTAPRRPATAKRAAERAATKRPGPSSRAAARTAVARAAAAPAAARVGGRSTVKTRPAIRRSGRPSSAGRRISGPSRSLGAVVAAPAVGIARRVSLQRLTHTRAWIGVVAFALIGIVTMQVLLLELNTGIGHTLERTASLQRENPALSVATSEAGSSEAIESKARAAGMLSVAPGELHPVTAGGEALARKAARALRAESSSGADASSASTETTALESSGSTEVSEADTEVTEAESTEALPPEEGQVLEGEAGSYEAQAPEGETEVYAGGEAEEAYVGEPGAGEAEPSYAPGVAAGGGVEAGTEG